MKTIYFINPYKKALSVIPHFLKEIYLKKKYYLLPENKFLRKTIIFFYIKIFRKILILIDLLIKTKIIWQKPKKFKYIIFDNQSLGSIDKILPLKSFFVLTTRIQSFKEIYLNKEIIFYIFKNIFKNSVKINYICCLISIIKPKKIITIIDNSEDFHKIYKLFNKSNISFFALQNAYRNQKYFKNIFSMANYSGNYFCFGDYELNSIKKNALHKPHLRLKAIGSLKIELAKEYLLKRNKKFNQIYDICLISEAVSEIDTSGSLSKSQYESQQRLQTLLLRHTLTFCRKYNKKLLFLGRYDLSRISDHLNKEEEILFYKYKNKITDFDLKFFDKSKFENIKHLLQSKVIVGQVSTLLHESFGLKKKILVCDWEIRKIKKDFNTGYFPGDGILKLRSNKYSDFEKRLKKILSMNYNKYLSKTIKPKMIYNLNFKTLRFLRNEMKN